MEGIFPVANMLALATETIETHPDLDHWELPSNDLTNLNSGSMSEPYTSGSIGAAKNDNSGLAGLEIYLGASKGRRSRHRTLYTTEVI